MRLRATLIALFCAITCASYGCGPREEKVDEETATSGTFELVADEMLRPVVDSLVNGFMQENPKAKITARYVPAGVAIQELFEQKARLVIVGRFLNKVESELLVKYNITLPPYDIAQDALICVANKANPVSALAMADLGAIVRNEAKQWGELKRSQGAPSGVAITRVLGPVSASSESLLDSLFLKENELQWGNVRRFSSTDSILRFVASEKGALGFIGASWKHQLETLGDSTVKILPIIPSDSNQRVAGRPVIPHLAYIYQGLYPLTMRVNGFTYDAPNSLPRGFLAYAMTANGQTVFKNFDVLPRTQIIKIVPSH